MRLRPPVGSFLSLALFQPGNGLAGRLRQRGYSVPRSYSARSLDALFAEMADAGIDRAVIVGRGAGRGPSVPNAEAAALVAAHPDRFAGFVGGVSLDLVRAIGDVRDCADLGAVAIAVEPGFAVPPVRADDESLLPVYRAAAERGLPLFVTGGDSGPDTAFASPLWLERAAGLVPEATFVAVHGGWPYVREMVAVALRRPNVWVMPDLYAARFAGHAEYVEAANGMLRERMLFATSYPAVNLAEYVRALRADGLTDDAWRAIAIDNPRRFLAARASARPRAAVTR